MLENLSCSKFSCSKTFIHVRNVSSSKILKHFYPRKLLILENIYPRKIILSSKITSFSKKSDLSSKNFTCSKMFYPRKILMFFILAIVKTFYPRKNQIWFSSSKNFGFEKPFMLAKL